ncbi:MAG: FAD-binding oxidoreductase, partial [Chloroflexota bacterium]|nr:FAD-binding oxidoreductase [Chloroflexota bacterium]
MKITTDVAIIGGGVIGCSIAYYLSKAGVDVTLIERGDIAAEASGAAAGLLAPLGSISRPGPFADFLLESWAMFPALVPVLEQASGIKLEYAQTGALRVMRNPKNVDNLRKRMNIWQPFGLEMYWLTGDEARQQEALLAADVSAALYAPQEGQILPASLTKALAQAAQQQGAHLYSQCEVTNIVHAHGRIEQLITQQGDSIHCKTVIFSTGAWSERWSQTLGV